jgi:hypothetical protein
MGWAGMGHVHSESALLAAWSMKVTIEWPRFILSLLVLAGMIFAAAYAYQSGDTKKKK